MRMLLLAAATMQMAMCGPPPGESPKSATTAAPSASAVADAPATDDAPKKGDAKTCAGSDDCPKGEYCQKGIMSDPACTGSPNIMNAVILCKGDADCKGLCAAFKGGPQCGKKEGTCNCDGKK